MKPHVKCLIREHLDRLGWSQTRLAETARVKPSALCRIIKGERAPRVPAALRLARALGVTPWELWPEATPKRHK